MLLIVCCAGHARHNSEDGAEPIIGTVNRIGHPTAPAPMPALAFQDRIECGSRTGRRSHRIQCTGMCFFLDRALTQKIAHIFFSGQRAIALIAELRLMFFFGCFHSTNSDLGPGNLVPPTVQPALERIFENGRFRAEVAQFFFPTLRVPFLCFRHTQENAFAFFIRLASGQVAID